MKLRDCITITETSAGLYCVRVTWLGHTQEAIELTREDAWPVGHDMLCDMIESSQAMEG